MSKLAGLIAVCIAVILLASCGVVIDSGNVKVQNSGKDIVSIGRDGFNLEGNVTGVTLDSGGLRIQYPNGNVVWDSAGFDISHADGNIRIADGKMVVTDKDGKAKTLDTTGQGAEYTTDGGVAVKTGEKAAVPQDYPNDKVPLMDGFSLNASAELGSVMIISGYVPDTTVVDALEFYQPLLMKGSSYSQDKKDNSVVLRSKMDGVDITVYLCKSLSADAVNISVAVGK
jgi:major membrane immunogen (membrane-anchored lipoprotein)